MFVKHWMTEDPVTAQLTDSVADALDTMQNGHFRRMPVVDEEGQVIGILSREDILNAMPSLLDASFDENSRVLALQGQVKAFMTQNPLTVSPADPLEKAAFVMRKHKVGGIPVTQEGKLVGILTESDVFNAFTELMGMNEKGIRMEISLEPTPEAFWELFRILREYQVVLNTMTLCSDFSKTRYLLTIGMESNESGEVIDALWAGGFQITSILGDD